MIATKADLAGPTGYKHERRAALARMCVVLASVVRSHLAAADGLGGAAFALWLAHWQQAGVAPA